MTLLQKMLDTCQVQARRGKYDSKKIFLIFQKFSEKYYLEIKTRLFFQRKICSKKFLYNKVNYD